MDAEEQTAGADPAPGPAAPVAMKQRKNRGNLRKRATDEAGFAEEDNTAVVRKAKQQRGEPLAFSTKKDDKDKDVSVTFASTAAALAAKDESAFKTLETETEFDRDAR